MDNVQEIMDVLGKRIIIVVAEEAHLLPELNQVNDRDINLLSGGELQRFAIGIVCVQEADVYDARPSRDVHRLTSFELHV